MLQNQDDMPWWAAEFGKICLGKLWSLHMSLIMTYVATSFFAFSFVGSFVIWRFSCDCWLPLSIFIDSCRCHIINVIFTCLSGTHSYKIYLYVCCTKYHKKSPANAKGNAQQRCMFECPVKQILSQSSEGARRLVANYL